MLRRRDSGDQSQGAGGTPLADEAEAFLNGTYLAHLASIGRAAPGWAWINPLAHGTRNQLVALAQPAARGSGVVARDAWDKALAFLAHELLKLTARDVSLIEVQRTILVPLELELAARRGRNLNRDEIVTTLLLALREPTRRRDADDD